MLYIAKHDYENEKSGFLKAVSEHNRPGYYFTRDKFCTRSPGNGYSSFFPAKRIVTNAGRYEPTRPRYE